MNTDPGRATEFDDLLMSSEFIADPYPTYRRLQAEAPVYWSEAWGSWLLTRYEDCAAVLRDPGRFSNSGRVAVMLDRFDAADRARFQPLYDNFSVGMPNTDPPAHTRIRALVNRAFTPRAVERMEDSIRAIVRDCLNAVDPANGGRSLDLVADLAQPLPARVITEMLGVPVGDRAAFQAWSNDIVAFFGSGTADIETADASLSALAAARELLTPIIDDRRRHPGDDLISGMVHAEVDGGRLTEREIVATSVTLMTAGHETTTTLISAGLLALLRNPDELRDLAANPSLVDGAIEELLRFDAPFQQARRRTTEPVKVGGVEIPADAVVSEMVGAANRDPARFEDPDRLDIRRRNIRHLSFGLGIHFCVGAALARLEGRIALMELVDAGPRLALDEPPSWRWNTTFRGLTSLPVQLGGATDSPADRGT